MGDLSKHFSKAEFKCKCGKCGFAGASPALIEMLEDVREHFKVPLKITSGCRCKRHNRDEGGKPNSEHICTAQKPDTDAADFRAIGVPPEEVYAYLDKKNQNGGVGRYNTFTHTDCRGIKVRWDYRKKK